MLRWGIPTLKRSTTFFKANSRELNKRGSAAGGVCSPHLSPPSLESLFETVIAEDLLLQLHHPRRGELFRGSVLWRDHASLDSIQSSVWLCITTTGAASLPPQGQPCQIVLDSGGLFPVCLESLEEEIASCSHTLWRYNQHHARRQRIIETLEMLDTEKSSFPKFSLQPTNAKYIFFVENGT